MFFKPTTFHNFPGYLLDDDIDSYFYWQFEHMLFAETDSAGYTDRSPQVFCVYYTVEELDVGICYGTEENGITLCLTNITPGSSANEVIDGLAVRLWNMIISGWEKVDGGKTIGKNGNEAGKIIIDLEYRQSARVTLEENAITAPFMLTLGIYGLMFHSAYFGDRSAAEKALEEAQYLTWKIFKLGEIEEEKRDKDWNERRSRLMLRLGSL